MDESAEKLLDLLDKAERVAAFTGAGVSTLCGIPDFRGPQGLYKQPDAERIFDIDWFDEDPSIYYKGCAELVYGLKNYQPGPVHFALVALEKAGKLTGIATQNIDMLHQKAGSSVVHEVHGSPILHHCRRCGDEKRFEEICAMLEKEPVARCSCGGVYKPDITFFGESLPEAAFEGAIRLASTADLILVLGSSLTVQPAGSIPLYTLRRGGKAVVVNAQPTCLDDAAALRMTDLKSFADAVLARYGTKES